MKRTFGLIATCWLAVAVCQGAGWVKLFDGKTLNGWAVHSGKATYVVDNGTILGTAVLGSPNSFLCTNKEYGDFTLEFEVKVDPELNSGVQFRSQIYHGPEPLKFEDKGKTVEKKLPEDRVYGYQVEIATHDSASSGNVYDEARRGRFLDGFSARPAAKTAFKDHEWNKYRVECKGDSIRTWVNGVLASDFKDAMTAKGIIGLQVHGVGQDRFKPYQVRWRNIRIRESK
ncbi:MAG: DUF1080 domain-containing protein [Bryobacteraceae bacterium]